MTNLCNFTTFISIQSCIHFWPRFCIDDRRVKPFIQSFPLTPNTFNGVKVSTRWELNKKRWHSNSVAYLPKVCLGWNIAAIDDGNWQNALHNVHSLKGEWKRTFDWQCMSSVSKHTHWYYIQHNPAHCHRHCKLQDVRFLKKTQHSVARVSAPNPCTIHYAHWLSQVKLVPEKTAKTYKPIRLSFYHLWVWIFQILSNCVAKYMLNHVILFSLLAFFQVLISEK